MSKHIKKVYRFGKVYWKHPLDSGLFKNRTECITDYNFCKAWQQAEEKWDD